MQRSRKAYRYYKVKNSTARASNIELLRIISMAMVVALHAFGHGGVLQKCEFGSLDYIVFYFFDSLCYVAVNVFVLITGYFMVQATVKPSRIVKLVAQVWFYSIAFTIIAACVIHTPIGLKDLFHIMLPLMSNEYWFASTYALLLVFAPALNLLIRAMTKSQLEKAILILIILFSLIPTVIYWSRDWLGGGLDYGWFIVLYFIAAYIRLYGESAKGTLKYFLQNRYWMLATYFFCVWGGYCKQVTDWRFIVPHFSRSEGRVDPLFI